MGDIMCVSSKPSASAAPQAHEDGSRAEEQRHVCPPCTKVNLLAIFSLSSSRCTTIAGDWRVQHCGMLKKGRLRHCSVHRVVLPANCCQPQKPSDCVLGKVGDAVRSSQGGGVGDEPLTQEQLSAVAAGADHPHLPSSQQDDSAADRSLQGPAYQRQGSSRKRKHGSPAPESPKAAGAAAQAAPKEVSSPQAEDV